MKIALISPNKHHLEEMGRSLRAKGHRVALIDGGKSKMRSVAEQEEPDLMLVDGMCCDSSELLQVEYLGMHHPKVAVILLCATHTPEFLLNSMRAGVREVLPSPVAQEALDGAVERIAAKLKGGKSGANGKILAFMPCKGGSGATFISTNVGYRLAESRTVLLIDLNLQFGDALSFVHDGKPSSSLADVSRDIGRLDASLLAASAVKVNPNYSILAAPDDISKSMEVKPEHIDAILEVALGQYDYIVLDMGRTLDTLAIKAMDRSFRIFPVLQASLPGIRNAKSLLAVFKSLGYPTSKVELIVNRFEKGGAIGLEDIQRSLGSFTVRTIPNSFKEVNTAINQGNALSEIARTNVVSKTLGELALSLSPRQEDSRGVLARLFRRA